MMFDYPELYAYWSPRLETAAACADRLRRMFVALPAIHPVFASVWHQGGTEEKLPLFSSWPPELAEVLRLIEAGVSIADGVDEPRPEWGYNINAWCGASDRTSVSIGLSVGSGAPGGLVRFRNTVRITPFVKEASGAALQTCDGFLALLRAVTAAWEPDYAIVSRGDFRMRLLETAGRPPDVEAGWMTYLSADYARRIVPPAEVIVELAPSGVVLLATREPFDIGNPDHVAAVDKIQTALAPLNVPAGRRA
jgi:hypothetical protein